MFSFGDFCFCLNFFLRIQVDHQINRLLEREIVGIHDIFMINLSGVDYVLNGRLDLQGKVFC